MYQFYSTAEILIRKKRTLVNDFQSKSKKSINCFNKINAVQTMTATKNRNEISALKL